MITIAMKVITEKPERAFLLAKLIEKRLDNDK